MTFANHQQHVLPFRELRDLCGEREAEFRGRLDGASVRVDLGGNAHLELQGPERAISIFAQASRTGNHCGLDIHIRCAHERAVAFGVTGVSVEVTRNLNADHRPIEALCIDGHTLRLAPLAVGFQYTLRVQPPPPTVLKFSVPPAISPGCSNGENLDDSALGYDFEGASLGSRALAMA